MNGSNIEKFRKIVKNFYKEHRREMPWRKTRDPYRILVSEIMLQQTQVSRVLEKYPLFIKRFPTIKTLAKAPLSAVLRQWSGLGYNRRAKFLKQMAEIIVTKHQARVPEQFETLIKLPGVGKSTAGGILAFGFNKPAIFIETNIRRVFLHHFFPNKKNVSDLKILPFLEMTMDRKNPREWYYALFDYGTHLGQTVTNPNRRSRHYTKQSRFSGSRRQLRGHILKSLFARPKTIEQILQSVEARGTPVQGIVHDLLNEGFIKKRGIWYMLK